MIISKALRRATLQHLTTIKLRCLNPTLLDLIRLEDVLVKGSRKDGSKYLEDYQLCEGPKQAK